jgi:5-methylcytosine-specific restriction endonuclease McrA
MSVAGGDTSRARRRERRRARQEARDFVRELRAHPDADYGYTSSHAGHPLGVGYPAGSPLRADDGETHREAWKRIIRGDACAYCGRLPFPCRFHREDAGTVDHIDPQAGPRPANGLHSWTNYTGSCARCNNSKDATPMLLWIARRGVLR